jgi:Flp pilus assembly protein TadB
MMVVLGVVLSGGLIVVRHALRPVPFAERLHKYGVNAASSRVSLWTRAIQEVRSRSRIDATDVAIIETTQESIAANRLLLGVAGAGVPLTMWVITSLGGSSLPVTAVVLLGAVFAVAGFQLPANRVRTHARIARRRFRTSLSAYLDLVSIMLAGGAGIETALHATARIGDGPTFEAISEALEVARATRRSPWDTLADVGSRVGVAELPELAATVRLGGEQGARMTASLVAKASGMRLRELADVEARANEATERMGIPMVLLFIGFLVLLGYPAMHLITSGFEG